MEEELETVLEVGQLRTGGCNIPGVLTQVTTYQLSEKLVEIHFTDTLQCTEGKGGGAGVSGLGEDLKIF